jgi:hypothetical protein
MLFIGAAALLALVCALVFVTRSQSSDAHLSLTDSTAEEAARSAASVLPRNTVLTSLASGAPPTPWMLTREDRNAAGMIENFFARSIPVPTSEGRTFTKETIGHAGPQLEVYVPIVSTRRPVAVLARSWDSSSGCLESNIFFNGAVDGRLAEIVAKMGFERTDLFSDRGFTVFRNRRGSFRRRSA